MLVKQLRFAVAIFAAGFAFAANAQQDLGASCGCPPTTARAALTLSFATSPNRVDLDGNLTNTNTVLSCDTTYTLGDKIYVGDGKTLTIAPGTLFKSPVGPVGDAHALIVSRGGKIFAPGTCDCPIVFTATDDPMNGTYGIANKGKWGGIVLLGKARNNLQGGFGPFTVSDGIGFIEGFLSAEERNKYGAAPGLHDDNDNSGIMTYVSIRHGGDVTGANNELNGLSLGSVGRGTTLQHIEIVANNDDGVEFFGGTVDLKYASVFATFDDAFDWDQGWAGRGQFWVTIKSDLTTYNAGDNGFELDSDDGLQCTYHANPKIYNCTFIGGAGVNGGPAADNNQAIEFKEASRGEIRNCIFSNFNLGVNLANTALGVHKIDADGAGPGAAVNVEDCYNAWFTLGTLKFENNTFIGCDAGAHIRKAGVNGGAADLAKFTADGNTAVASLTGFSGVHSMNVTNNVVSIKHDLLPGSNITPASTTPGVWYTPAPYRGAFKVGEKSWLQECTLNALIGLQANLLSCPTDLNFDGNTTTADYIIFLGGYNIPCQ